MNAIPISEKKFIKSQAKSILKISNKAQKNNPNCQHKKIPSLNNNHLINLHTTIYLLSTLKNNSYMTVRLNQFKTILWKP